jgi:hypothetical protein
MAEFIFQAHSGWRWIVLLSVVIAAVKMLVGWLGNRGWSNLDGKLLLAVRIGVYIQMALGIALYLFLQRWGDMRFTAEHVVMALLAVGGIEFGAARARKATADKSKFRFASIGLAIAFGLIVVALRIVGGLFAVR